MTGGADDKRAEARQRFLDKAGWGDTDIRPLAGDASFRTYYRITTGTGRTAVLMDAPPPVEDTRPFLALAIYLRRIGLSAPDCYAADTDAGFLLLEDMGDALYRTCMETRPGCERELYGKALGCLLELQKAPPPETLPLPQGETFTISPYSRTLLRRELDLFADWYLDAMDYPGTVRRDAQARLHRILLSKIESLPGPDCLVLRDFHADNLLDLPGRRGVRAVGLLDFQDAVAGHPAYDLVSLLEDARRDVPEALEKDLFSEYWDNAERMTDPGPRQDFEAAYALFGAQRNLKIIGIFTRLSVRDGKPAYLRMIPRVWSYLERNLRHPALREAKTLLDELVPPARRRKAPRP